MPKESKPDDGLIEFVKGDGVKIRVHPDSAAVAEKLGWKRVKGGSK